MSDALKSNTTLKKLNLKCEHKNNAQSLHLSLLHFYPFVFEYIGNNIGEAGATSLSDALKINTTLISLHLGSLIKWYT